MGARSHNCTRPRHLSRRRGRPPRLCLPPPPAASRYIYGARHPRPLLQPRKLASPPLLMPTPGAPQPPPLRSSPFRLRIPSRARPPRFAPAPPPPRRERSSP
ncbi:hypothetical protein PVAP13_9KG081920 [Panicum virgatum]|uniref:Uncharacterized protein n=1 Tax=Panicum virgatum TaxID=38727 RepID=A0A8T0NEY4_PANVG|nr:hypothetical protein PVAP13_9KG081920 [Panicum virgatum]